MPVNVDLDGATEFVLPVDDGGDGIGCDQADWAEAQVMLEDGRELWLGDLPLVEGAGRKPLSTEPPFSFTYDGKPSAELLPHWKVQRASREAGRQRASSTRSTYTDDATGLAGALRGVEYRDFPTVEWTVYFRNTGTADTPILADIQALDLRLQRAGQGEFVLHHHRQPLPAERLRAARDDAQAGRDQAHHGRRRTAQQQRPAVLQPRVAGRRRDRRRRLAGPMGRRSSRATRRPACASRRPGDDALQAASRRGDPHAADGAAVLAGRLDPRAERLAALDAGPQPAAARRQAAAGADGRVQFAPVRRDDQCQHRQPEAVHRPLLEERLPARLLVDGRRLVSVRRTGWPNTGTWEVDTKRFPGGLRADLATTPTPRASRPSSGSSRSGCTAAPG